MGTVVTIEAGRQQLVEAKWDEFTKAAKKAQRTLDIQDGILAGRAWSEWLKLFTKDDG